VVEHRPVEEVVKELGLTADQVYDRQHRLMKKLRFRVGFYTGEPLGCEKQ
jgi:hypothetical protein